LCSAANNFQTRGVEVLPVESWWGSGGDTDDIAQEGAFPKSTSHCVRHPSCIHYKAEEIDSPPIMLSERLEASRTHVHLRLSMKSAAQSRGHPPPTMLNQVLYAMEIIYAGLRRDLILDSILPRKPHRRPTPTMTLEGIAVLCSDGGGT
jgi:hypothetical protein